MFTSSIQLHVWPVGVQGSKLWTIQLHVPSGDNVWVKYCHNLWLPGKFESQELQYYIGHICDHNAITVSSPGCVSFPSKEQLTFVDIFPSVPDPFHRDCKNFHEATKGRIHEQNNLLSRGLTKEVPQNLLAIRAVKEEMVEHVVPTEQRWRKELGLRDAKTKSSYSQFYALCSSQNNYSYTNYKVSFSSFTSPRATY